MKLKSIRAYGFKSFADKIDIELKTNITAIVGPNGSGKSNIVDAVRWVLGEQSVKSLRGSNSMTDVIFSGSETRDPLKRAEVALVFDNSTHFLNTELEEVEVKRILYQNGENEYFINNAKVRLKDITNLFLDSGIGVDSFNIISQGSVDAIVDSKPLDRRVILEGASRVLKYKNRKLESVKKLEKTKDNLEKVSLVTDELELSVKPLKEQSEVAKKYLAYKEELEDLEISLTTYDITNIHENYKELHEEIKKLESEKETLEVSSNKENGTVENLKLKLVKIEEELQEKNNQFLELTEEISHITSEKTLFMERQNYVVDQEKMDESFVKLKNEELALKKELAIAQSDVDSSQKKLNQARKSLGEEEEKLSLLTIKKKHLDSEYESALQNNFNLKNRKNLLEVNIEQDLSMPSSVKNVINNPRLKGIHGTIGKILEIEDAYVTAIDVALGSATNFIVVENPSSANAAIEYLKNNHLGRATFFPLNVIKSRMIPLDEKKIAEQEVGFIGIASDLVQYKKEYEEIIKNQLGNVVVVQNLESLQRIGKKLNYKYRVVSIDGEILHAGGSLTGGSIKEQHSTLKQKQELQNVKIELENNEISIKSLEEKKKEIQKEKEELEDSVSKLEKNVFLETEHFEQKENTLKRLEKKKEEVEEKSKSMESLKKGSLEEEFSLLSEEQNKWEVEKELCEKQIEQLRKEKSEISSQITELEQAYRMKNQEYHTVISSLKTREIELGKLDTKMDYLLNILSEDYHLTYEKAKQDYILDLEPDIARMKVTNLKRNMKELGDVNLGSISEYERIHERYDFLMNQKSDLEHAMEELYQIIEEMDSIMEKRLKEAFEKISKEFQITFKKMFKGGEGILKLTDPDHILESGIDIIAEPPGKKLRNMSSLSGGEKTLTAISLLFAILNAYPVPFCILDEVEAALDEANVDTFGKYLQEQKEKSEFLLITHKKRTMEYATTLYGITMQEQGVSKIVSVSLEETK